MHMNRDNIMVFNADNADSSALLPLAHEQVRMFSRKRKSTVWLDGNMIKYINEDVLDINDIKLPGMHNIENYMAAIAAVWGLVDKKAIQSVAKEFGGVDISETVNGLLDVLLPLMVAFGIVNNPTDREHF